jgi:ribonuclease III
VLKRKIAFLNYLFSREKAYYYRLRKILGFFPFNISYYKKALTHRSAAYKDSKGYAYNNERLEYLGDAILDSIVAEYLFIEFPHGNEGLLTKLRSKIVSGDFLNYVAIQMKLGKLMVSNTRYTKNKKNLYGNALEALIGAVYMDCGYKVVRSFILTKIIDSYVDTKDLLEIETNYKSKLIEWAQKDKKEIDFNTFQQPSVEGQNPIFTSVIKIDNQIFGSGEGKSKKEAEQKAAKDTLIYFGLN